jgi:hypothetical protein
MRFLVIDDRFATPIYVILEADPSGDGDFPGLRVHPVTLEERIGPGAAVGRHPHRLDLFREFRSEAGVTHAGFILIEPRYIGPSWFSYLTVFRPEGEKPHKRARSSVHPGPSPARATPRLPTPQ